MSITRPSDEHGQLMAEAIRSMRNACGKLIGRRLRMKSLGAMRLVDCEVGVAMWVALLVSAVPSDVRARAWRCGTEYTNNAASAQRAGCRLLVENQLQQPSMRRMGAGSDDARSPSLPTPENRHLRVDRADQRKRDSEVRSILSAELKKAEERQAELLRDYKLDGREKPAEMVRNESDIAAIRREISRFPAAP
jgi:hypothetical protein